MQEATIEQFAQDPKSFVRAAKAVRLHLGHAEDYQTPAIAVHLFGGDQPIRALESMPFDPHLATGREKHHTPPPPVAEGPPEAIRDGIDGVIAAAGDAEDRRTLETRSRSLAAFADLAFSRRVASKVRQASGRQRRLGGVETLVRRHGQRLEVVY